MRTLAVSGIILLLFALGWNERGFGEPIPTPQGELRIVDKHHANWISVVLNVFEHLFEFDKDGTLVPRLATSWRWLDDRTLEFILRQGVRFHNGEVFDADIVKLNWEDYTRLQQPSPAGAHLNFKPGSRLEILDLYTVRFVFLEPDGGALTKLSLLHMATGSSNESSAGARKVGEFSKGLARGARARINWWKESPCPINGPTGSSWKPTWTIGTGPGCRACNELSLTILWSRKMPWSCSRAAKGG